MADRIADVARALNRVASAGQARAAVAAAQDELARGMSLATDLSIFTTPNPAQARDTLNIDLAALAGELRAMDPQADTDAVNPTGWARCRRFIERGYIDVSGIEGQLGAQAAIDVGAIIWDAVRDAPRVLGDVADWSADILTSPIAAFLNRIVVNLWFWLAVVAAALYFIKPLRALALGLFAGPVAAVAVA